MDAKRTKVVSILTSARSTQLPAVCRSSQTERLALQCQLHACAKRELTSRFRLRTLSRQSLRLLYHVPLGATGPWATTLADGANHAREIVSGGVLDATNAGALLESSITLSSHHTLFGRGEVGGNQM